MSHIPRKAQFDRSSLATFNRDFYDAAQPFTCIGTGDLGGKAQGLAVMKSLLDLHGSQVSRPSMPVTIPNLAVITTEHFDHFMQSNNLYALEFENLRDDHIALHFQEADLPADLVGDLFGLISKVHSPLAIRSSSLLEDALYEPFAGVYATKMVPNNQLDVDTRFQKLVEAVKFVYASTFFRKAREYVRAAARSITDEKMAVIIQEIVGSRMNDRYYPHISGVVRSYNYYPTGRAKPEDGVAILALGLGKTIVDGGDAYQYSPGYRTAQPPSRSIRESLQQSQLDFWAVNMGKPPEYDPIHETEYLERSGLSVAELDGSLRFLASTYNVQEDRVKIGVVGNGPRLINFAPILAINDIPLDKTITGLLDFCHDQLGMAVEMEFAVTLDSEHGLPARFGLLQVRPMVVSTDVVNLPPGALSSDKALAASEFVMGNGAFDDICDILYVKPEHFSSLVTRRIVEELAVANRRLLDEGRRYLLIGFGRWGSSDPSLGIPVGWGQIAGAKVIVEATLPNMNVDLSQGSHFFHNISSFQVLYFSVSHYGPYQIDWRWLESQPSLYETPLIRHVRLEKPLAVKVDGRCRHGVILHG